MSEGVELVKISYLGFNVLIYSFHFFCFKQELEISFKTFVESCLLILKEATDGKPDDKKKSAQANLG